ncbi:CARDB domain-containing protein [Halovivax cerinus]|uniref:CARDB domain-containing protein n=1 Tax=Halovivax cerinus TaxID=1487865 RepID=A0ABD5NUJ1_9EURY|nr:CARDB domain-containing protein [Halovivax cerinus]
MTLLLVATTVGVLLGSVGLVTAGSIVGDPVTTQNSSITQVAQIQSDGVTVEQGDRCLPVTPFGDGSRSVADYYDYRTPNTTPSSYTYSSYGTTQFQADDTSTLFVYDGAGGRSLVVVHDRLDGDTDGGSATMAFDDLPIDGEWTVEDDAYDGRDDVFTHRETSSRITWVWTEGRSDGAAFTGLDGSFAVTVTPAFNEDADERYTDGGYDGQVTDWQVVTNDGNATRTSLALDDPITVRSGACSTVTELDVDDAADAGEPVSLRATVTNDGDGSETVTVPFVVDGDVVDERTVTLAAGETTTISTSLTLDEPGTRTVAVGDRDVTFDVVAGGPGASLPGFGVVAGLAAFAVAVLAARRR